MHLIVPKAVTFAGAFDSDWPQILPQITALLGHTQELAVFDVSKRSLFYPFNKEPRFVHPPQQPTYLYKLSKIKNIKFSPEDFERARNEHKNLPYLELEPNKLRHQAGTVLVPELEDGENLREVGYLYFYKQPDGNFSWFAKPTQA